MMQSSQSSLVHSSCILTHTHAHAPIHTYALLLIICRELSKQPLEKQRKILILRKSFVRRKKREQKNIRVKTHNLDVSRSFSLQSRKATVKKCTRKCTPCANLFFANQTYCFFCRSLCRRHFALHDFIFCVSKL